MCHSVSLFSVVSTTAIDCQERFISEMIHNVSSGMQNTTSSTHLTLLSITMNIATTTVTVTATVTRALVLCLLLEDQGHITESIRILVSVDRMEEKCFQITTKWVHRSQQFQLRRQPVLCSWCSNREGSVANSSTCTRHDEGATLLLSKVAITSHMGPLARCWSPFL